MPEISDDEILDELGLSAEPEKKSAYTPREERVVAGFEDIQRFVEEHGRIPEHGEGKDIFERLYAVRLDRLRELKDCRELLAAFDHQGLLSERGTEGSAGAVPADDAELLAELGLDGAEAVDDITQLRHVKPRTEVRTAEDVASRVVCADFDAFRPLFDRVREDIALGVRETRRFEQDATVKTGEFFIYGGQLAYVASMGEEFVAEYGRPDRRLRVIYDNGTESNIRLRSFQRGLYKDDAGRRITDPSAGPLFGNAAEAEDLKSGTVYVLRSRSDHPEVVANRELIHKVGVTGGRVENRVAQAALDATYLLADVEVVATYKLFNINRTRLENLLHRVLAPARLDLTIEDRFGNPVRPREWFLVPLQVIDEIVEKVRDGSIVQFRYDPETARLVERVEAGE